ncbi:MAG TPA: DUF6132 family protein [Cyclobacteriaceae bacterium]|nr:DUF6132 family protein [Cyclobacteriaceae bacterium]
MQALKKYAPMTAGILLGSLAGYFYWKFVGCTSGACPITSNPLNSTLYGAAMGAVLGFPKKINQ